MNETCKRPNGTGSGQQEKTTAAPPRACAPRGRRGPGRATAKERQAQRPPNRPKKKCSCAHSKSPELSSAGSVRCSRSDPCPQRRHAGPRRWLVRAEGGCLRSRRVRPVQRLVPQSIADRLTTVTMIVRVTALPDAPERVPARRAADGRSVAFAHQV